MKMHTLLEAKQILWPKIEERSKTRVKAKDNKNFCCYRADRVATHTSTDNCCFVGVLIPPDFYDARLEGKPAYDQTVVSTVMKAHTISLVPDDVEELGYWLFNVQNTHDRYLFRSWNKRLREAAPVLKKSHKGAAKETPCSTK